MTRPVNAEYGVRETSFEGDHHDRIPQRSKLRVAAGKLGDSLYFRTFERQVSEAHVGAAILSTFSYLPAPRCRSQASIEAPID